ncbi:hypothetical protein H4S07_005990, partial [Coemansia furcata]
WKSALMGGSAVPSMPYIAGLQQAVEAPLLQAEEIGASILSESGGGVVRYPTLSKGDATGVDD